MPEKTCSWLRERLRASMSLLSCAPGSALLALLGMPPAGIGTPRTLGVEEMERPRGVGGTLMSAPLSEST